MIGISPDSRLGIFAVRMFALGSVALTGGPAAPDGGAPGGAAAGGHGDQLVGRHTGAAGDLVLDRRARHEVGEQGRPRRQRSDVGTGLAAEVDDLRAGRVDERRDRSHARRAYWRLSSLGGKPMRYATARPIRMAISAASTTSRRCATVRAASRRVPSGVPSSQRSDPSANQRGLGARPFTPHKRRTRPNVHPTDADRCPERHRRSPAGGSRRAAPPVRSARGGVPRDLPSLGARHAGTRRRHRRRAGPRRADGERALRRGRARARGRRRRRRRHRRGPRAAVGDPRTRPAAARDHRGGPACGLAARARRRRR